MPQNQISGKKAQRFGLCNARKIAKFIGAKMCSNSSNECDYKGQSAVIKSARMDTKKVGVTDCMVRRVKFVIAGFETAPGKFCIWKLPIEDFKQEMKVTAEGKPNMVQRSFFEANGCYMGKMSEDCEF